MPIARGTFDVSMEAEPPFLEQDGMKLNRNVVRKEFSGDVTVTSEAQMVAAYTATPGSDGYVAIEHFSGSVGGRSGAFVLQNSGLMDRADSARSVLNMNRRCNARRWAVGRLLLWDELPDYREHHGRHAAVSSIMAEMTRGRIARCSAARPACHGAPGTLPIRCPSFLGTRLADGYDVHLCSARDRPVWRTAPLTTRMVSPYRDRAGRVHIFADSFDPSEPGRF